MICKKCGTQLEEDALFCGNCGSKVEPDSAKTAVEDSSHEFVYPEIPMPSKTTTVKRKNNMLIPIISISVVAIVLIVALILFLLPKFLNTSEDVGTDVTTQDVITQTEDFSDSSLSTEITEIEDSEIRNIINQYSNHTDFGIYVHNLNNDYEYGFNDDSVFLASAMCQVVILDTLSRTVEDNNIDISQEELYFSYIPNGKEAPTSKNESDTYISLKKCIEDVAVYGDNNKSNHIVDYIGQVNNVNNGFDVINNMLRRNGYTDTHINRKTFVNPDYIDNSVPANTTTPSEIADIFENLINNGGFGNKNYMMNIFKSVALDGQPIGLKKCVPAYYDICNVNALNSQSTNNVAIISDGNTELAIAILSTTDESKTDVENNEDREIVIAELMKYILDTQFEN